MLVKCAQEKHRTRRGIGNVEGGDGRWSGKVSLRRWHLTLESDKGASHTDIPKRIFQASRTANSKTLRWNFAWNIHGRTVWPWIRVREQRAQENKVRDMGPDPVGLCGSLKGHWHLFWDGKSLKVLSREWPDLTLVFTGLILASYWRVDWTVKGGSRESN